MKITLLHPSRGRAKKAFETYEYWIKQSSGKVEIEHILGLDKSDNYNEYLDILELNIHKYDSTYLISDNSCVVEATNSIAKHSKGDILIYLSDDFKCPKDWDLHITDLFDGVETPILLKVDDCLQKFHIPVLTIPIMNRALYEKLGYFWHPEYKSMFVDEDLFWTCKNNGWIVDEPGLKFPHEHHANGKSENDETYKRSSANWNQGKEVFRRRKLENFPL